MTKLEKALKELRNVDTSSWLGGYSDANFDNIVTPVGNV